MNFGWLKKSAREPKDGEVRVRVLAAGVSLPDLLMREGVHPEKPPRSRRGGKPQLAYAMLIFHVFSLFPPRV